MNQLKAIIECLLFVADEPLTVDRLKSVLPAAEGKDIRQALSDLAEDYEARRGGFYLKEVAGGYQLRTRPEYKQWVQELVKPSPLRLSRAALETLAIIAYKQPIIRADIEHVRGVDSGGVLRMLLEKKLVRVLGRKDIPGRPMIYATTKRFLELFDLKDLKDLPTPKEIEALGIPDEPNAQEQKELPIEAAEDCPPSPSTQGGAFEKAETDTANTNTINTTDENANALPDTLSVSVAETETVDMEAADAIHAKTQPADTAISSDVLNENHQDLDAYPPGEGLDRNAYPENTSTENDLVSENLPSNEENTTEKDSTLTLQPYTSVTTDNAKVEPEIEENEEKKGLT